MSRSKPSSAVKRPAKAQKTHALSKKELKYIQGMLDLIQLLLSDDGISVKIPDYWFASISQSFLYDTLRLTGEQFFYDRHIDTQELEAYRTKKGLNICFLEQNLRVNVELFWHYKEMLTCFYKIIALNNVGGSIDLILSKFKDHLVAYVVESIECSVDYDVDEAERYLAQFKDHFWCDFDSNINEEFKSGSTALTDLKLRMMESYAQTKCSDDYRKFLYGVIVFEGKMILTVNPYCKASCPVFNVELRKFVNPNQVVPTVNKILMMAELARKQLFGQASVFE